MNLILFTPEEAALPLPRHDPRALHILSVLRREPGDCFDVGLLNGPRGKATLAELSLTHLHLTFTWGVLPPALPPITLLIGLPRPQTARKILQEATTLGVSCIHFFTTDRGESSYAQSTLWSSGEWRRHLQLGAEQAFCTRIPQVTWGQKLDLLLAELPTPQARVALDNYESPQPLGGMTFAPPTAICFGPERGFTPRERELLRAAQFHFAHLGTRVLRLETAVTASLAILHTKLGHW